MVFFISAKIMFFYRKSKISWFKKKYFHSIEEKKLVLTYFGRDALCIYNSRYTLYKVEISVCLSVCLYVRSWLMIPMTHLPQILIGKQEPGKVWFEILFRSLAGFQIYSSKKQGVYIFKNDENCIRKGKFIHPFTYFLPTNLLSSPNIIFSRILARKKI